MKGQPEFLGMTNDPTCGHQDKGSDAPCGAAATWHLVFTDQPPIDAGLACDDHAIMCIRDLDIPFLHRVERACLTPSPPAMFVPEYNRCILPETVVVTAATEVEMLEKMGIR